MCPLHAQEVPEFFLSKISHTDIFGQLPIVDVDTTAQELSWQQAMTLTQHYPIKQSIKPTGDVFSSIFIVHNDTSEKGWFVYPYGSIADTIALTVLSPDGTRTVSNTGYRHENPFDYHYGSVVTIPENSSVMLLITFKSEYFTSPFRMVFYPVEYAADLFAAENIAILVCLGICLALSLYNFFLFTGTRENQYLFYALSTLGFTLAWALTFGVQNSIWSVPRPFATIPLFFCGLIFAAAFASAFLKLKHSNPKLHRTIQVFIAVSLVALPFSVINIGAGVLMATVLGTGILLFNLYAGITRWRSGYTPARYFVIALLTVMIPNLLGNLMSLNILPGVNINSYLLALLGHSVESLLLAFALADKVALVNRQNLELTQSLEANVHRRTQQLSETNEQLQTAIADLEDANRAKDRFLANISHEIRTPLTSIMGYAEHLSSTKNAHTSDINHSEVILQNAEHLLSLINDMLDISKIEADKIQYNLEKVRVPGFVNYIHSMCAPASRDKDIEFSLDCQYPLPTYIHTDKTRLTQILFNLTSNALKFTHQGRVNVLLHCEEDHLYIEVADTGIGMADLQIAKAFEAFEQGDISIARKYGGTGLGLNITKHLVEGLGGEIHLSSEKGKGTLARVTLPAKSEGPWIHSEAALYERKLPAKLEEQVPMLAKNTVLLAEDNEHNRQLFKHLLEGMNLTVLEAEDGDKAIEMANAFDDIALLILDIQMPEKSGIQVLETVRHGGFNKPAIAFTANHTESDIRGYLAAGFFDCIRKPIIREQMLEVLGYFFPQQNNESNLIDFEDKVALVEGFTADLHERIALIKGSVSVGDMQALESQSHALKGAASSFGWDLAGDIARKLETCARRDQLSEAHGLVESLETLIAWTSELPMTSVPRTIAAHGQISVLLRHWSMTIESLTSIVSLLHQARGGSDHQMGFTQMCKLLFFSEKYHLSDKPDIADITDRLDGSMSEDTLKSAIDLAIDIVERLLTTGNRTNKANKLFLDS